MLFFHTAVCVGAPQTVLMAVGKAPVIMSVYDRLKNAASRRRAERSGLGMNMSFWEELSQKITQGGQGALQKTKELADVVTMNAAVSDSKRKIRDLHEELGMILAYDGFNDLTADQIRAALESGNIDSLVREIKFRDWKDVLTKIMYIKSEEEVIAINEGKIKEIKSDMKCPSCGRKITKGMLFCPDCGTKIVFADEPVNDYQSAEQTAGYAPSHAEEPTEAAEPEMTENAEVPEQAYASDAADSAAAPETETNGPSADA